MMAMYSPTTGDRTLPRAQHCLFGASPLDFIVRIPCLYRVSKEQRGPYKEVNNF